MTLAIFLSASPEQCTPEQIDSFCQLYPKMIQDKQDAIAATKLPIGFKRRLLTAEKLYLEVCPKLEKS